MTTATITTPHEQVIEAIAAVITLNLIKKTEHIDVFNAAMEDPSDLNVYTAFRTLVSGRYRVTLKKHDVHLPDDLPKPLQVEAVDDGWQVTNLFKGTQYEVTRDGFALACTCQAAQCGNYCSHMAAVEDAGALDEGDPIAVDHVFIDEDDNHPTLTEVYDQITDEAIDEGNYSNDLLTEIIDEMGIVPTDDQWAALHKMIKWWESTTI